MNKFDKYMIKERKKRYKMIKKLHKCRDMASKYNKQFIPLSKVVKYFGNDIWDYSYYTEIDIANEIVEKENMILGILPKLPVIKIEREKSK